MGRKYTIPEKVLEKTWAGLETGEYPVEMGLVTVPFPETSRVEVLLNDWIDAGAEPVEAEGLIGLMQERGWPSGLTKKVIKEAQVRGVVVKESRSLAKREKLIGRLLRRMEE